MNPHRQKLRRQTRNIARANSWIGVQEDKAASIAKEMRTFQLGAFVIVRHVLRGDGDGLHSQEELFKYLNQLSRAPNNIKVMRRHMTTLLTPKEGRLLADPQNFSKDEGKIEITDALQRLPDSREGFFGRAMILGAGIQSAGRRFVVLPFRAPLSNELKTDRRQLFADITTLPCNEKTPSVPLMELTQQAVAERIRDQINEMLPEELIPVKLGSPLKTSV